MQTSRSSSTMAIRRSKKEIVSPQPQKPPKLTKKNLNGEFTAVSEEIFSPASKESEIFSPASKESEFFSPTSKESEISPVSEVDDGVISPENCKALLDPDISALSETLDVDVTPSSKITNDQDEGSSDSVNQLGVVEPVCLQLKPVEAEVVTDHLGRALFQIMNSGDVDRRSKKLVEALVQIVINDFEGLPEEEDMHYGSVTAKCRIMLLCLFMWILIASVVVFLNTGIVSSSFSVPPPT